MISFYNVIVELYRWPLNIMSWGLFSYLFIKQCHSTELKYGLFTWVFSVHDECIFGSVVEPLRKFHPSPFNRKVQYSFNWTITFMDCSPSLSFKMEFAYKCFTNALRFIKECPHGFTIISVDKAIIIPKILQIRNIIYRLQNDHSLIANNNLS